MKKIVYALERRTDIVSNLVINMYTNIHYIIRSSIKYMNVKVIQMNLNYDTQPYIPYTVQGNNVKLLLQELNVQGAICVQRVNDHVFCNSHGDAQFAAVFIDP